MRPTPKVVALLLTFAGGMHGCGPLTVRDEATGSYIPMQRGTFELHKEVRIPAGRARVFFQGDGPATGLNEFQPHCQLEINTLSETTQTVRPDSFRITGISTRSDQVVGTGSLDVAAISVFGLWGFREPRRTHLYLFSLHSDRQPDVRQLNCGGAFDHPGLARPPTLQEIGAALGRYGTLKVQ